MRTPVPTCRMGSLQPLPGSTHHRWKGCLAEARTGSGTAAALPETAAARFAPPSQNPFAQGFFTSGFGNAYQCLDPRSADFPTTGVRYQACYQIPSGMDAAQLRESSSYLGGQGRRFPTVFPNNSPQRDCANGTATILPLSTDPVEIKERIEKLSPVGSLTYSALGLLWGQRLLMPSWKSAWGGSGAHPLDPTARRGRGTQGDRAPHRRRGHVLRSRQARLRRQPRRNLARRCVRRGEVARHRNLRGRRHESQQHLDPVRQSSRAVLQPEGC